MTDKTLQELAGYVRRTYEIDESGDANLHEFLFEQGTASPSMMSTSHQVFVGFLIWANGENWEQFLDHAKVGDVPPGK